MGNKSLRRELVMRLLLQGFGTQEKNTPKLYPYIEGILSKRALKWAAGKFLTPTLLYSYLALKKSFLPP